MSGYLMKMFKQYPLPQPHYNVQGGHFINHFVRLMHGNIISFNTF